MWKSSCLARWNYIGLLQTSSLGKKLLIQKKKKVEQYQGRNMKMRPKRRKPTLKCITSWQPFTCVCSEGQQRKSTSRSDTEQSQSHNAPAHSHHHWNCPGDERKNEETKSIFKEPSLDQLNSHLYFLCHLHRKRQQLCYFRTGKEFLNRKQWKETWKKRWAHLRICEVFLSVSNRNTIRRQGIDGRGYLSSWLKGNKLNLKSYYKAKMSLTCSL